MLDITTHDAPEKAYQIGMSVSKEHPFPAAFGALCTAYNDLWKKKKELELEMLIQGNCRQLINEDSI